MKRTVIMVLIVLLVLIVGFFCYTQLFFSGTFDKKYSREKLAQNFIQHENDFTDLIAYFKLKCSAVKEQRISFGLSKGNKVSLSIYPIIVDPANKIVGGDNLELGSPKLDSALTQLGWTNETVKTLKEKLVKTNCDWIRTTEIYGGNPIEMYSNQSGWSSYSYLVFDIPLSDSLIQIHGKPISNSEFGKRVVLDYSSAL